MTKQVLDCDVLIVGAGAGGSTVANVLAEQRLNIIVIEEGAHRLAQAVPDRFSESLNTMWRQGGLTMAFGRPSVAYAEGRCVGGGTEINSAIIQRTPAELLDTWGKEYAIDKFSAQALEPHYEHVLNLLQAKVTPEKPADLGPPSEIFRQMGKKMGWETTPLARAQEGCVGTNHCSTGCPTGGKQNLSTALWPSLLRNKQVRLFPDTKLKKMARTGQCLSKAEAISVDEHGCENVLEIHFKDVFICGGATQTPAVLQQNGLLPRGASGLQLHPTLRMMALFNDPVNAPQHRLPLYAITEFMPDFRLGGSVITHPTLGMFRAEDPALRAHMAPAGNHSAIYYAMSRGVGRGRITALPFGQPPLVQYKLAPADWAHLHTGTLKLAEGLFAVGAKAVQPSIAGMPAWRSMDDVQRALANGLPQKRCHLMTIHLFSSLGMGAQAQGMRTDSFGKFHGLDNLYVADASLIPASPGVNPQATVMAIAHRNAQQYIDAQK